MTVASLYSGRGWCRAEIPVPWSSRSSCSEIRKLLKCEIIGKAERESNILKSVGVVGVGVGVLQFVSYVEPAFSLPLQLHEPPNALSLPTWAVHVSSVAEWIIAMALVWQYGEKSGHQAWKGLSWGMVPLLGGALCACTWHFFYNSESLEVLVALQAALTVIGNFTMCIAAYRIYKSSSEGSKNF
ncbi:hypothetical protein HN51_007031 [Arachis hypogaea]|uniref:Ycf49-like protein n=1 Tax=Arachis hypogaea TaxID=3818 RepID=A0A444WQQ7_ARAHY|nr:uncharacterized protein LOC112800863 [Arachis hypogaea]QHO41086.1 Ycf49-like protein [Arachis hypogaea]RYQ79753.1 hypothetical protein Ahy_Scaffold1g106603 isoform A [Arachis hypogaea]